MVLYNSVSFAYMDINCLSQMLQIASETHVFKFEEVHITPRIQEDMFINHRNLFNHLLINLNPSCPSIMKPKVNPGQSSVFPNFGLGKRHIFLNFLSGWWKRMMQILLIGSEQVMLLSMCFTEALLSNPTKQHNKLLF